MEGKFLEFCEVEVASSSYKEENKAREDPSQNLNELDLPNSVFFSCLCCFIDELSDVS